MSVGTANAMPPPSMISSRISFSRDSVRAARTPPLARSLQAERLTQSRADTGDDDGPAVQ